jgi:hypothetical protein
MAKVSKETASHIDGGGPVDARHEDIEDGWTIDFVSFSADIDATPLMHGLPDDRCPCPHWGYVKKGRVTYRFADHDEVCEAGDAFYLPPGHIPIVEAGTEIVQFSPTEEIREVAEVMGANMQKMMAAQQA